MNHSTTRRKINIAAAVYERLDLSNNIEAMQSAVKEISTRSGRLWAWLFLTVMTVAFCLVGYYIDLLPSYHFGVSAGADIGADGVLFGILVLALTLLPTAGEVLGPTLGGRVWFLNHLTNFFVIFDAITDRPLIASFVNARMAGRLLLHQAIDPALVVATQFVLLIFASVLVEVIAISLFMGWLALTWRICCEDIITFRLSRRGATHVAR